MNDIPRKANRVFNVILLGLILILVRVWYLAVVTHDDYVDLARKPQRRTVVERVERGTIRDRFGVPLALNRVQYNAAVCYSAIRDIPRWEWRVVDGKRVRVPYRSEYVKKLSELLGEELEMDSQRIEDTIHGKAALFPHTPFVIKEDIGEGQYYRLKMLEKDWVGIEAIRSGRRVYPQGRVGADVIGYLGQIGQREYEGIAREIEELQSYVQAREEGEVPFLPKGFEHPTEVKTRLKELQEKAYTINDKIGKAGIEAAFDEQLRGRVGKKIYEVDIKGNTRRLLPGVKSAVSGQRVILSLSAQLQKRAEELLAESETWRGVVGPDGEPSLRLPWIKGGAIVAMDPKTGEVLALATSPRFDPNDFIFIDEPKEKKRRQSAIRKWLENEAYIGEVWDGKRLLERECFSKEKGFYEETLSFNWERYLDAILPQASALRHVMDEIGTVKTGYHLLKDVERLLELSGQTHLPTVIDTLYPTGSLSRTGSDPTERARIGPLLDKCAEKDRIDRFLRRIKHNDDKILIIDLCRMVLNTDYLTGEETESLSEFRKKCQEAAIKLAELKEKEQARFHAEEFQAWREQHFKEFLKQKRLEEKEKRTYARPYTDYLDAVEKKMFAAHWAEKRKEIPLAYRTFEELDRPLYGRYRTLRNTKGMQLEKHLAAAFYPLSGFGYTRSQAYRQLAPQGSVFKLIVAYQALLENEGNPLTLIDDLRYEHAGESRQMLGTTLDGQTIHRIYKGAKLPRSSHAGIGKVDLLGAIEQSSNIYFSILAAEKLARPEELIRTSRLFGFGARTGIELPGEITGYIPEDIGYNLTGLYSFAIGQHSLVVTPLQTALMTSALANKGKVIKPKIVNLIAGKQPLEEGDNLFDKTLFPYQDELAAIGIEFPLFTATLCQQERGSVETFPSQELRSIPLPEKIHDLLSEGMRRVISGPRGTARPQVIRTLRDSHEKLRNYLDLKNQVIGKTGTAQILYKQTLDVGSEAEMYDHVWFSGISYPHPIETHGLNQEPELVVVVYLRFGDYGGKETAPIAFEIIKKWRDTKYQK